MTRQYEIILTDLTVPLSFCLGLDIGMKLAGAHFATCYYEPMSVLGGGVERVTRVVLQDGAEFYDPLRVECGGLINNGVKLCYYAPLDVTDFVDLKEIARQVRSGIEDKRQDEADRLAAKKGIGL